MSNGWNLTGRLIAKHFSGLGDTIATMLATFDPETATETDRDALDAKVKELGAKFHTAQQDFNKESEDVRRLKETIQRRENVAAQLAARIEGGEQIDEATLNLFIDELEASKGQLPQEIQEEADAKAVMDEIQSILTELSTRLQQFDARAAKAKRELAAAQAQHQNQQLRAEQLSEARALAGNGGASTGMGLLEQRAAKLRAQTAGIKTVNDIAAKPEEDRKKLEALMQSVERGTSTAPSALDRLRSLSKAAA